MQKNVALNNPDVGGLLELNVNHILQNLSLCQYGKICQHIWHEEMFVHICSLSL